MAGVGVMGLSINIFIPDGENVNVHMKFQAPSEALGTHRL